MTKVQGFPFLLRPVGARLHEARVVGRACGSREGCQGALIDSSENLIAFLQACGHLDIILSSTLILVESSVRFAVKPGGHKPKGFQPWVSDSLGQGVWD